MIVFLGRFQLINLKKKFLNLLRGFFNVCFALKLRNTLSLNVVVMEIILIDITWKMSSNFLQTLLSSQAFLVYYSLFLLELHTIFDL